MTKSDPGPFPRPHIPDRLVYNCSDSPIDGQGRFLNRRDVLS